jgi:hypothetical protein
MICASPAELIANPGRTPVRAPAPFLPMTRQEMEALGWDQCDVIIVTGDAYVDHPSFGSPTGAAPSLFAHWASRACSSA